MDKVIKWNAYIDKMKRALEKPGQTSAKLKWIELEIKRTKLDVAQALDRGVSK